MATAGKDPTGSKDGGNGGGKAKMLPKTTNKRTMAIDEYGIRMGPGWTLNDGTFEQIPPAKRRKQDVPYPAYINTTFRAMNGLSNLQISCDAPVNQCAIEMAGEHFWRCLPPEVHDMVTLMPPNGPDLWSENQETVEKAFVVFNEDAYKDSKLDEYRAFKYLRANPWTIWPIWVEDQYGKDWVTLIWYATARKETPKSFDQIQSWGIVDPRRSRDPDATGRHPMVQGRQDRLRRILERFLRQARYTWNNNGTMFRVSPMPLGECTSGERCFAAMKELMSRILTWHMDDKNKTHRNVFVRDMSRWVNPYQQRIEMAGINAWMLMSSLDYDARIAVERIPPRTPFEVMMDGEKRLVYPYDLAGPFEKQTIANADYVLDANAKGGANRTTTGA
ncbi:hypothetical protein F4778DRAFT_714233 [Xylariomycetidae sp. FL2044]|nr:hypothetical protein F4778DRAFT_714233 [Xylariomycetidae sp. FL2044]